MWPCQPWKRACSLIYNTPSYRVLRPRTLSNQSSDKMKRAHFSRTTQSKAVNKIINVAIMISLFNSPKRRSITHDSEKRKR